MTISADMVWEVRANGVVDNGGGFVAGASGTDFSQQDSAQITRTDIVIDATNDDEVTSAGTPFTTAEVGNILNITDGTGFFAPARFEITAVDGGNKATLDRAAGNTGSTGGEATMGGAGNVADDGILGNSSDIDPGNTVYIKADGTYTLTADIGAFDGSENLPILVIGYNTTRGDNPVKADMPVFACGIREINTGDNTTWEYVNAGGTSTEIFDTGSNSKLYNCVATNTSGTSSRNAIEGQSNGSFSAIMCEAECTNGRAIELPGSNRGSMYGNYLHDSVAGIFYTGTSNGVTFSNNIIDTCTTGIELTSTSGSGIGIFSNTIYNCTKGIDAIDPHIVILNNIIDSCTTGIEFTNRTDALIDWNNFSNNTADVSVAVLGANTTSASPGFADAANGDFAPGAGVKATSSLGVFPGGLTTGFLDQGAVQHEDTGGGGGGTTVTFCGL